MPTTREPTDFVRLEQLVTSERMAPYLAATHGDLRHAFELYDWNVEASAAVLAVVARVEVVLRNALDRRLRGWATKFGLADWVDDPPLDDRGRRDVVEARRRVSQGGRTPTHGHIVAELNLGFWRYLISKKYFTALWIPDLADAFPFAPANMRVRRAAVEHDAQGVLFLRNRAAHHEPIHRRDLIDDLHRALRLAAAVDPVAEKWVRSRERITEIAAQRPTY